MRKVIAFIVAMLLVMSMAISAFAATPAIRVPHIEIPKIEKVEVNLPDGFWDNYFAQNPIRLPANFKFNFGR